MPWGFTSRWTGSGAIAFVAIRAVVSEARTRPFGGGNGGSAVAYSTGSGGASSSHLAASFSTGYLARDRVQCGQVCSLRPEPSSP